MLFCYFAKEDYFLAWFEAICWPTLVPPVAVQFGGFIADNDFSVEFASAIWLFDAALQNGSADEGGVSFFEGCYFFNFAAIFVSGRSIKENVPNGGDSQFCQLTSPCKRDSQYL